MCNQICLVGLDIGNRYVELKSARSLDELIVSWREIDETEYRTCEVVDGMEKVRYQNKYYIVGLTGTKGINNRNKGHQDVCKMANMIKLVMIARDMRNHKVKEQEFKIVTGTPYDDFDKNYKDYIKLMKSPNNEYEYIELDSEEYKILVSGTEVTKQGACVILTLPERKEKNYLIFDWGGETLECEAISL